MAYKKWVKEKREPNTMLIPLLVALRLPLQLNEQW